MSSLFEIVLHFGEEYEDFLNHIYIFLTFVVMYSLLHNGGITNSYIFTLENTLIFFVSLCAYHLLFSKILKVQHESSKP
jgi:hypothetical protein